MAWILWASTMTTEFFTNIIICACMLVFDVPLLMTLYYISEIFTHAYM